MYTVYKITNLLNEKTYIGVHKTNDPYDSYMGSGSAIKNAIKKHGKENFKKEVLLVTENKADAYELEKKLTIDYNESNNYNMRLGGVGGFTKENALKGFKALCVKGGKASKEQKAGFHSFTSDQHAENGRKGGQKNKGRKRGPLSEEIKQKMRETIRRKKELGV